MIENEQPVLQDPATPIEEKRWEELKLVQYSFVQLRGTYFLWFTWFNTVVFASLILLAKPGDRPEPRIELAIAVANMLGELAAIGLTLAFQAHIRVVVARVEKLIAESNWHQDIKASPILGSRIVMFATWGCMGVFMIGLALSVFALNNILRFQIIK